MAEKALVSTATLNAIGQAIIDKGGATSKMLLVDMPAAIRSIYPGPSTIPWENVTGKPSTFPPSSHTHTSSDVTDLTAAVNAAIAARCASLDPDTSTIEDVINALKGT